MWCTSSSKPSNTCIQEMLSTGTKRYARQRILTISREYIYMGGKYLKCACFWIKTYYSNTISFTVSHISIFFIFVLFCFEMLFSVCKVALQLWKWWEMKVTVSSSPSGCFQFFFAQPTVQTPKIFSLQWHKRHPSIRGGVHPGQVI